MSVVKEHEDLNRIAGTQTVNFYSVWTSYVDVLLWCLMLMQPGRLWYC